MFNLLRMWWLALVRTATRRLRRGPSRPSWSFGFEVIVTMLRLDWERTADWPIEQLRAYQDARPSPRDALKRVTTEPTALGGRPATRFHTATSDVAVLFLHGGSYVYGSMRTHGDLCARLALATGFEVWGLEYRLAPEHPYPAALDDTLAALRELRGRYRVVLLAGDSAGGNLALATQLRLRDGGEPQAPGAVVVSPWVELSAQADSYLRNDPWDFGTGAVLERQARQFAGALSVDDPRLSLRRAELRGLAPVALLTGEVEIPHDDQLAFVAAARTACVSVELEVCRDMPHDPPLFAAYSAEGARALDWVAAALRRFARRE